MRWVRLLLPAIVLAAALAGCGSTVQGQARRSGATGDDQSLGDGLSGAGSGQSGGVDDAGADAGTGGTGPGLSGAGGSAAGGSARGGSSGGAGAGGSGAAAAGGNVVGVSATEIRIGYGTQKDADTAAAGFGLNAVFGDQEGQARAIVDDINARGGVLGRKFVLVVHDDKTANDNANPDITSQAQCVDWTQDRPVFAGVNIVGNRNRETFFGCMAKARTPLLISDLVTHSRPEIETFAPYLYAPGVATFDRWIPTWIERLDARGYFQPWDATSGTKGTTPARIGVPYEDSPKGDRYYDTVKRELTKVGRKVDDTFALSADDLTALQQIPQMMLRFRSHGVTHVLLPASAYLVTPVAERQGYRPRYAMTTLDALTSLTLTTSPPQQLHGTVGIGWLPISDVDAAHDPGPVSPNQTRCLAAMSKAGLATSDRLTLTTQLIICDLFLFFAAALQHAGSISASALQQGAAALGDTFPSALTFAERYGPGRYDGADAVRDVSFDEKCSCFLYLDAVNRRFP